MTKMTKKTTIIFRLKRKIKTIILKKVKIYMSSDE